MSLLIQLVQLHLLLISQGDTYQLRNANQIFVKYINIHGYIKHNASSTVGSFSKIFIVQDKQQVSDTDPAISYLLKNATPESHLNAEFVGRFKILATRSILTDPNNLIKKFNINKKVKVPVRYNGTANTDIQRMVFIVW